MDEVERDRKIKNLTRNGRVCALATVLLTVFTIGQHSVTCGIAATFTALAALAYGWAATQLMDGSKN